MWIPFWAHPDVVEAAQWFVEIGVAGTVIRHTKLRQNDPRLMVSPRGFARSFYSPDTYPESSFAVGQHASEACFSRLLHRSSEGSLTNHTQSGPLGPETLAAGAGEF